MKLFAQLPGVWPQLGHSTAAELNSRRYIYTRSLKIQLDYNVNTHCNKTTMDSRANLPTNIRFKSTNPAKIFILLNEFRTFSYQTFLPGFTNVQRLDKFSYSSVKHLLSSLVFFFSLQLYPLIISNYTWKEYIAIN